MGCRRDALIEATKLGRIATHSPKAEALRPETMRTGGQPEVLTSQSSLVDQISQ
ncbi:MAG: hypothetical protein WBD87_14070 [Candidatus Acidiferrales bacterium]